MFRWCLFVISILVAIVVTNQLINSSYDFLPTKSTTMYNILSENEPLISLGVSNEHTYFIENLTVVITIGCVVIILLSTFVCVFWQYFKEDPVKYIKSHNITISSIVYTAETNAKINLDDLFNHITIDDTVVSIEYKSQIKSKNSDGQNVKRGFDKCLKMISCINSNKITFKIFTRGVIQFFGCNNYNESELVLNKLLSILESGTDINNNDGMQHIDFIKDYNPINLKINAVYSYNFRLGYYIDCEKLQEIFLSGEYLSNNLDKSNNNSIDSSTKKSAKNRVNPCSFKFRFDTNKHVTIMACHNGKITISGLTNFKDIVRVHQFIKIIMDENPCKLVS